MRMLNVNLEYATAGTTLLFAEELVVSSYLNFLPKHEQKLLAEKTLIKQAKSITKLRCCSVNKAAWNTLRPLRCWQHLQGGP